MSPPPESASPPQDPVRHIPTTFRYTHTQNRPNRVRVSFTRNRIPSTAPCKTHPDTDTIHTYTKTAQILYVSPPPETASPPQHHVCHIPTTFRHTRTQKTPKSCTCLLHPKPHPLHSTMYATSRQPSDTHVHKNRPNRVRVSSTRKRIPSTAPCKTHPDNLPIHTYTKTAQIMYVSPLPDSQTAFNLRYT